MTNESRYLNLRGVDEDTFHREKTLRLMPHEIVQLGNYILRYIIANPQVEYYAFECDALAQEVTDSAHDKTIQLEVDKANKQDPALIAATIKSDGFIYQRHRRIRSGLVQHPNPLIRVGYLLGPHSVVPIEYDLSMYASIMDSEEIRQASLALIKD